MGCSPHRDLLMVRSSAMRFAVPVEGTVPVTSYEANQARTRRPPARHAAARVTGGPAIASAFSRRGLASYRMDSAANPSDDALRAVRMKGTQHGGSRHDCRRNFQSHRIPALARATNLTGRFTRLALILRGVRKSQHRVLPYLVTSGNRAGDEVLGSCDGTGEVFAQGQIRRDRR